MARRSGSPDQALVAEFSVYLTREARSRHAGTLVKGAVLEQAGLSGCWKLVSRVFREIIASRALPRELGFREVGLSEKRAPPGETWRDVVLVQRSLPRNFA